MANKQETLIYIEKENITEAEFMSRNFVKKETKNRAYLNALGAELIIKYLASEGVDVENLHNVHSISKILEKYDIADILLPNIHLDVRVVFDENQIFIPKTHFENGILPDAYAVIKIDNEFKTAEFLGYFKTNQLDKKFENTRYYFFPKENLITPDSFAGFVKRFAGRTSRNISSDDLLRGRELAISLADHNINKTEERELLELLMMSDTLRESILEFDNFETLSYSAAPELVKNIVVGADNALDLTPFEFITAESEEVTTDNTEESKLEENPQFEILDTPEQESILEPETTPLENLTDVFSIEEFAKEDEVDEITNTDAVEESLTEEVTKEEENHELTPEEILLAGEEDEEPAVENIEDKIAAEESIPVEQDFEQEEVLIEDTSNIKTDDENEILEQTENSIEISESNFSDNEIDETDDIFGGEFKLSEPDIDLGDSLLGDDIDTESAIEEKSEQEEHHNEETFDIENNEDSKEELIEEKQEKVETDFYEQKPQMLSVDDILDQTIASIDKNKDSGNKDSKLAENIVKDIAKTATVAGTIAVTETVAAAAAGTAGEISAAAAISQEAIKLASVSGEVVNNVVNENIDNQNKNLNRIDIEKTDITPDVKEIPENLDTGDSLAISKLQADAEAEESGQFEAPKDLSELNKINDIPEDEGIFEEETINLDNLDTIGNDLFKEGEKDHELGNLSDLDFNPKQEKEFLEVNSIAESEIVDLPNMSSFTIDEEGNSNIDDISTDFNINANENSEENLVDINSNGDLVLDGSFDFDEKSEETFEIPEENASKEDEFAENFEQSLGNNGSEEIFDFDNVSAENEEEIGNIENTKEEEKSDDEENWMNSDYDNLENIQQSADVVPDNDIDTQFGAELTEIPEENIIVEPSEEAKVQEFTVVSNSTVISDKTFNAGEIPIDINNPEMTRFDGPESLEEIYDSESGMAGASLLKNPGTMSRKPEKSSIGFGLGIIGAVIALAIVGIIGFSVAKMFKSPTQETPQPITDEALPEENIDNVSTSPSELNLNDSREVAHMDEADRFNDPMARERERMFNAVPTPQPEKKQDVTTAKNLGVNPAPAKVIPPTAFIEIKKLSWEVPDYISYNQSFKQYFQSVGKSLKLALASDLLLANDYTYTSEIKVSVTYDKEGLFKNARIVKSSGSTQIDQIVLQTVNQTLKYLKAPHSVGNDENTTAILKIYL